MTNAPQRKPRQPKLRSSCDECGSSKLKCDRGQPECGRCLSLGLVCVYSVSRKMGKPPREKPRIPELSSVSRSPGKPVSSIDGNRAPDRNSCSSGTRSSISDGVAQSSGPVSSVDSVPMTWDAVDGFRENSLQTSAEALDALHGDLLGPLLPDFSSVEFDYGLSTLLKTGPISALQSPEPKDFSTPAMPTEASQARFDDAMSLNGAFMSAAGSEGHSCSREAYDTLGGLAFPDLPKGHSLSQATSHLASTTASAAQRMPVDHILRLARESSERLGRLLTCSCARYPHLAFLYASIISRVLVWYQQAAGCTQKAPWGSTVPNAGSELQHLSPPGSLSESPLHWSSAAGSAVNGTNGGGSASVPAMNGATAVAVTPTKMAMGTFEIDDERVQIALTIQLVLGETKKTGSLIDLFTSWSSSGVDEFTIGGADGLYKSLGSWLRREYSRVVETMQSRLKEIST